MNVMIRENDIKLLTHVTSYRRRFLKLALFSLAMTSALLFLKGATTERIGEPEVILTPAVISMLPVSSDAALIQLDPPPLLVAQEDAGEAAVNPMAMTNVSSAAATLFSLEGISLEDNTADVTAKKGPPSTIVEDPQFIGETIYQYPNFNVGFYEDVVSFVQVSATVGHIQINDQQIPLTVSELKQFLGEPDFVAEDGLVFQRRDTLIKLFVQPETQELISVDYYHLSST
ncbi:hypothetical protein GCM10008018_28330 [Paenibacillus marchantiophytorum]|uniref:Uncharacterized protein n=1 Tax=Paenibacillus marchantiophytorum TaxID=1619310 RepID=A0ABQ1EPD0_9BACL|nr:hypothetical protein [Paenibacillus marchantiophytorum]GFZ81100.1 hypothetical protein GCM10008018_28330 [Paenibacillus marchantiophytorum]